jgi:hypothetical protein
LRKLAKKPKRFLLVDGFHLDRSRSDLSDVDRAVLLTEMRHRSFIPYNHANLADFTMQMWRSMDYRSAAKRVAALLAESDRHGREQAEQQAREQAALIISPVEFGWPASARIIVLDLSRITESSAQSQIASTIRIYGDVQPHPTKPLLGILTPVRHSEIQYALSRGSIRLEFVWQKHANRLLLSPVKTPERTTANGHIP